MGSTINNTGQTIVGTVGTVDADIDALEAWHIQIGNNSVIVADIDTGVDYNHPDLAANMWTNPGEIAGNGVDDDGNGYIDDVRGWDFSTCAASYVSGVCTTPKLRDNDPMDDSGHGTHTVGTIAAVGNNGIGVVGVSWRARIMALKHTNSDGQGTFNDAAAAIFYAANMGARVSNNSWGCQSSASSNCFSQTVENAIAYANSKGSLFVASAGNNNNDNDTNSTYPCMYNQPNVICVAATDNNDQRWTSPTDSSNYGATTVDLGAPGSRVLSTVPTASCPLCDPLGYLFISGTSMAVPHVSGAAALLLAQFPTMTIAQLRSALLNNVDPIPALAGITVTGGRLNINRALQTFALTVTKDGTGSGTVISAPVGISCSVDCTEIYNSGTSVTLTATPAMGSVFIGWSGGGCAGTGSCTVTMSAATSVFATFNLPTFTLTVTKAGSGSGTVSSSSLPGINCGSTCSATFTSGASVTLTATSDTGSTFAGWSGDSDCSDGSVTMSAAKICTATFNLVVLPAISVTPANPTISVGQTLQMQASYYTADQVIAISAGGSHSCALLTGGTVQCWGLNSSGQLGNGSTAFDSATPVVISGLGSVISISAGGGYNCALLTGGTVKCWGGGYGVTPVAVSGLNTVTAVSAGAGHTCALLSNGTVMCWGNNQFGQLGNNSEVNSVVPVVVSGLSSVSTISAGSYHTCAVLSDGTVKCWGMNSFGQIGNGNTTDSTVPVTVPGLNSVIAISGGYQHTCAVLSDGTAKCWGRNVYGQLGNGSLTNTTTGSTPEAVPGLSSVSTISAGSEHTCAVLSDGTVRCWGSNYQDQLGNGNRISSATPVTAFGLTSATAISAGGLHTCAVLSSGTLKCWGFNGYGEIGNGAKGYSTAPVPTVKLTDTSQILKGGQVGAAGAGGFHTCAALSDGTVECWGYNYYGQLGDGSTTNSATPVVVPDLNSVTAISGGTNYTCALLSDGTVKCWGRNDRGQLGNASTTNSATPVLVSGLNSVTAISAGDDHVCALLSDGTVKCWGYNGHGQLGNNNYTSFTMPVAVSGLNSVTAISAGSVHTCAALSDGTARCWGGGGAGQLGNNSIGGSYTPVVVFGLNLVTAISVGTSHSCAVLGDGTVKCWGWNNYGQLGNSTTTNSTIPVTVPGLNSATAIVARFNHTCVLLSDGTAKCWGYNGYGQLGNGTITNSTTPVTVSGLNSATAISASPSHTCVVLSYGTMKCWGLNTEGQLGNSATDHSTTPVSTLGLTDDTNQILVKVKATSTGTNHTCAVLSNGTVKCWGSGYGVTPVTISGISTATAISAGGSHTCALLAGGTVKCWGGGRVWCCASRSLGLHQHGHGHQRRRFSQLRVANGWHGTVLGI